MRTMLCLAVVLLGAGPALADMSRDLAGRTLVTKGAKIVLGKDGSMAGTVGKDKLAGSWSIRKSQMCRTITAPARLAGKACQDVVLEGNVLTVTRIDGSVLVYKVQ